MKITELLETRDSRSVYRTGMCDAMALALHEITKLPLGIWRGIYIDDFDEEEAYEDCHMCVVISFKTQKYLDVDGIHTGVPNCYFSNNVTEVKLMPLTKEEAVETFTMCGVDSGDIEKAKDFIKNDPMLSSMVNSISPVL